MASIHQEIIERPYIFSSEDLVQFEPIITTEEGFQISFLQWVFYFSIAMSTPIILLVLLQSYVFHSKENIVNGCCSGLGMMLAMSSGVAMTLLIRTHEMRLKKG